jgi:hypothetical protein
MCVSSCRTVLHLAKDSGAKSTLHTRRSVSAEHVLGQGGVSPSRQRPWLVNWDDEEGDFELSQASMEELASGFEHCLAASPASCIFCEIQSPTMRDTQKILLKILTDFLCDGLNSTDVENSFLQTERNTRAKASMLTDLLHILVEFASEELVQMCVQRLDSAVASHDAGVNHLQRVFNAFDRLDQMTLVRSDPSHLPSHLIAGTFVLKKHISLVYRSTHHFGL